MQRGPTPALLALLLLPLATGQPVFGIEGELASADPLEGVGALAPGPESPHGVVVQPTRAQTEPVLTTRRVEVTIERYETLLDSSIGLIADPAEKFIADWSSLVVARIRADPQVLLQSGLDATSTLADAATCSLRPTAAQDVPVFPRANGTAAAARSVVAGESAMVHAACRAAPVTSAEPGGTVFYGLDLQLRIPEGTREIRTGTLLQNDRGLPGRIIQLLHMRPLETGASFRIEESIKVDLYAPRLHLVGHLTTPPAHGQLTWGVASWTGDLDALRAAGHFDIAAQDPYTIAMSGETVTPPPAAAAGAPTAANGEAAWVVGAVATGLLLAAAALLFYARMSPSRALRHPRRQAILDYVRQNPGAEAASAGRHLGLSRGVLLHHLRQLRISGHLRVQKTEGRTALFAADAGWRGREAAAVLMRRETPRRLHACIDSQPGLDQAQLVHRLGLSQSRVSQVLNRLEAAGLLRKEIRGGRWAYYAEAEPTGASNPAPAEAAASAA